MRKTFFLTASLFALIWMFSIFDEKGKLSIEEEMALVLNPSLKFLALNRTPSDQVAEIDRQIQALEATKRGYEAKALRHDDYAERLQFQDRSYLEARRHMELADENREKAEKVQEEIDRLKAEKKRLLEGASQIQPPPSFVEPGL